MAELDIKWTTLERVLNEFADAFIQTARDNLQANGTNASNTLYDSFQKIIEIGEDSYSVSISLEDYWKYIEEGTGPQHLPDARSAYWPKIEPLKEWVANKPGVPKDDGFAYAVRWAIRNGTAEHPPGTKPQPFFEPAKEQTIRDFEMRINQAIEEDVSNYILEIVEKGMKDALT